MNKDGLKYQLNNLFEWIVKYPPEKITIENVDGEDSIVITCSHKGREYCGEIDYI